MSSQVVTITHAREQLQRWLAAEEACSAGSSYSIGGRSLTRQDVESVIRPAIQRWHNTVLALEAQARGQERPLGAVARFPTPGRGSGGLISQDLWEDGRT